MRVCMRTINTGMLTIIARSTRSQRNTLKRKVAQRKWIFIHAGLPFHDATPGSGGSIRLNLRYSPKTELMFLLNVINVAVYAGDHWLWFSLFLPGFVSTSDWVCMTCVLMKYSVTLFVINPGLFQRIITSSGKWLFQGWWNKQLAEAGIQCSAQVFKRAGCHLKRAHLARWTDRQKDSQKAPLARWTEEKGHY